MSSSGPTGEDGLGADDALINFHNPNRWFFDKSRLENTPSRRSGIDADKELSYRQQSANFIQDIGQRLQVNQLCINTAIVYMHRFYMYHSFTQFHRNSISTASIFLAAKVEEQPRKLDHFIKVSHYCLHRGQPAIDPKSEAYQEQSAELVMNENVLLQTLGFDVAIDHPHTHVVKCCQLVRASKDLAQTSYFMATNSLHLTTMCLQYRPTVVACVCIHLACKWSSWEIPRSKEGKDWWMYVDDSVTADQLETLTTDFLAIFNKSPSRLKRKIISLNQTPGVGGLSSLLNVPGLAGLTADSTTANNSQAIVRSRSRSPSPKRQKFGKPGESHGSMPPPKAHPSQLPPPGHHPLKPSSSSVPHGIMLHPPNKVGHSGSMKPPHLKQPPHPPVAKDHHQYKDPHHPPPPYQQQQQPHGKVQFPAHGHHSSQGPYPHGTPVRPVVPAQVHHSHSSQGHSLMGQKVSGRSSLSSSSSGGQQAAPGLLSVKPVLRTASLFSPEFIADSPAPVALKSEPPPSSVVPFHSPVAAFSEPSSLLDGNQSGSGQAAAVPPPNKVEPFDFEDISLSSSIPAGKEEEDEDESHKHKKKKKEKHKHKDKDKHKEEKKHKKDKHKEKSKHKDKHKDKARTASPPSTPETEPPRQNLKIKLSLNTGQR